MRPSRGAICVTLLCGGILAAIQSTAICADSRPSSIRVGDLRCESRVNPLGIDNPRPRLSWVPASDERGRRETACRVIAASTLGLLAREEGDLWDSGKTSEEPVYRGRAIGSWAKVYWKVRVWDKDDRVSPWSRPAYWSVGPLNRSDWDAEWIGATTTRVIAPVVSQANGYHALEAPSADTTKWVQVDLGESMPIDEISIRPARPTNFTDTPGFGFPARFKIEASDDPRFAGPTMIADHTSADVPNPGAVDQIFRAQGVTGRFVRVTATRLWERPGGVYCFALRGMQVFSLGANVSDGKTVSALDTIERPDWNCRALVGLTEPPKPPRNNPCDAAILLRKQFTPDKRRLVSATAAICGLGYYELYLNGKKVGDHRLDPGWTNYDKRCLYVTYDVTDAVKKGENAIGVILGSGWYNQTTPDVWGMHNAPWAAPSKLLFHLRLQYADGTAQRVVSDGSWKWSTGEIVYQNIRSGETHDMRLAKPGWDAVGYDDSSWKPVKLVPAPAGRLAAQKQPPIKAVREVKAVRITEPKPGVYVYKLPENITGWPRFRASGKPGQKITLRCSETLLPDGTLNDGLRGLTYGRWQTDEIILSGNGVESFEPHFTYHGFQHVQVEGLTTRPGLGDLVGVVAHTAVERTGSFECSNQMLNAIHEMCLRTYLNNLHSIPTDCPTREKLGWLCDGTMAMEMGLLNFDSAMLYEKWVEDMEDDQGPDGSISPIIPNCGWTWDAQPTFDPLWSGASVIVPWTLFQYTRDTQALASHYDMMKRYVDHLGPYTEGNLLAKAQFLGDWLETSGGGVSTATPAQLASNGAYFQCAKIASSAANYLNDERNAGEYNALAGRIQDALNAGYLDRNTWLYAPDTQAAPAMALYLRFMPAGQYSQVLDGLLKNIAAHKDHLSTGIVGTKYLFEALDANGRNDPAYKIVTQKDFPGWGDMLAKGATTVWEDWPGGGSHDHPALGSVDEWLYRAIGGIHIEADPYAIQGPIIRPAIIGDLTWAKASCRTPRGLIATEWRIDGRDLTMKIVVPEHATVYVPGRSADSITESGHPLSQAEGVEMRGCSSPYVILGVTPGTYAFVSRNWR